MRQKRIVFIAIICLAAFLRFVRLGSNPPSLYWDEASLGYNAYSILRTGRDEHGELFPITRFIAFGDYKPPLYIYLAVPSIALFGLNEFAVRFPSALAGTLTVLITYFLVKELFRKAPGTRHQAPGTLAAVAALLLAISPWHLQFSRGAFEANVATLLSTAGVYVFLKGVKHGKLLLLSAVLFALSMYTFNTHRVFIPLLIIGMALLFRNALRNQLRFVLAAFVLFLLLVFPLVPYLMSREGQLRFQEVTFFNDLDPVVRANERIEREGNTLPARVFHNRRVQFTLEFVRHYVDNLRPDFLFFSGDVNPRLGTRDNGTLYSIELPLLVAGVYFLVRKKHPAAALLFFWWLSGLLPAATARETPHALRTMNILPVPQIITAYGILGILRRLKRNKLFLSFLIITYSLLFLSYLHTYHVHYPTQSAFSWQYGYRELVHTVGTIQEKYDRIYVTTRYGRPYIYFLLYRNYPPQEYWKTRSVQRDWFGFWTVDGFDKYRFSDSPANEEPSVERRLVVSGPDGLPPGARSLSEIYFPDGSTAFEIGEL